MSTLVIKTVDGCAYEWLGGTELEQARIVDQWTSSLLHDAGDVFQVQTEDELWTFRLQHIVFMTIRKDEKS